MREQDQRLTTLEPAGVGAEDLTPDEVPFLRFDAAAQERFDAWRGDLEQMLRAEADHPVWLSHVAKYRSLICCWRPRSTRTMDIPSTEAFGVRGKPLINLKTAKALGLTIPQSLLLRADQVIE